MSGLINNQLRCDVRCCWGNCIHPRPQVVESEATGAALRKELATSARRLAEAEDIWAGRDRELCLALEDSRRAERRLDELRRHLEAAVEAATAADGETKLRLSAANGRVDALDAQLTRVDAARRDVEFKLSSIHSSLRRSIGFDQQRAPRSPLARRLRSASPTGRRSRPNSPTKGRRGA